MFSQTINKLVYKTSSTHIHEMIWLRGVPAHLDEGVEALVFLLFALDELQGERLVTTVRACCSLDLLFFLPTELWVNKHYSKYSRCRISIGCTQMVL